MGKHDVDNELVIGLITTVGTEVDDVIEGIKDQLNYFRYTTELIRVSTDVISKFETTPETQWTSEADRITHYMDQGNVIRERTGDNSILMKGVARELSLRRDCDENGMPKPRGRIAYIVQSLKHPDEVEFMRETYGDCFHLIGITSSLDRRKRFLMERKGLSKLDASELLERDSDEDLKHGQHTQDAFQHADFFININGNKDLTFKAIKRLIDLIFGNPFITPSFEEYAMFMAYSTSLRSADLSRQVGAVIANNNEILSMGANDCPKPGGGLYWPIRNDEGEFFDEDNGRDYMLGYDSNKIEQRRIIDSLLDRFGIDNTPENVNSVKQAGVGDLTEYGRVVHGEMEAILSCSRNNISCRDATLFVTTFPCHNCAKHIIASGIKRVVYIEPYPKSKAFLFYKSEITEDVNDSNKVIFEPFTGVGPQKFVDLFALSSTRSYAKKRKTSDGYKIDWKRESAELRNSAPLISYLESEQFALMVFEEETEALKGEKADE